MSVTNPFLICSNINVLHFCKKNLLSPIVCSLAVCNLTVLMNEKKIFNFYVHLSKLPRSSQPANILVRFSIVVIFLSIFAYCLQTDFVMYLNNKYMQLYLWLHSSYICELVLYSHQSWLSKSYSIWFYYYILNIQLMQCNRNTCTNVCYMF